MTVKIKTYCVCGKQIETVWINGYLEKELCAECEKELNSVYKDMEEVVYENTNTY